MVMAVVHDALQKSANTANEAIERIAHIRVLSTPIVKQREELQALYKKLERMQAKTMLLDQVVEDEYTPVTDEIIEDLNAIMARMSALI